MSIADKVLQLKQDIDDAYQAGYAKGAAEGGDSYYDTFWDEYQQNGERGDYKYAFGGTGWNDKTFKPKYKFINTNGPYGFTYMFQNHSGGITKITRDLFDLTRGNRWYSVYMFQNANINTVELDFTNCSSTQRVFQGFLGENITVYNWTSGYTYDGCFYSCANLKHLRWVNSTIGKQPRVFDLYSSTLLDKESIRQTIGILSDTATGSTLGLSLTAVSNAFELEKDSETGEFIPSDKLDEWNALIATKPNWTISLQ